MSPQASSESALLIEERHLKFDILEDRENRVAAEFGLDHDLPEDLREVYRSFGIDLEATNAGGGWRLPMPARYVIDGSGTIRYAEMDPDYTVRPEPEHTLEAVRALVG